jgi:FtsP/CotA-like multicopper oxidase with cupredoxin domain
VARAKRFGHHVPQSSGSINGASQALGVVAIDGVPINQTGRAGASVLWQSHLGLPPGGRMEFILKSPASSVNASLITRSVNTGAIGENDPERPLATIEASDNSPEAQIRLPSNPDPLTRHTSAPLQDVQPVRTRHLYFSEKPQDPSNPKSPTVFMLTVEGQPEEPFDPQSVAPNIIARQGDVEDWIIENRTQEVHAFHIHQIHFMVLDWFGLPVNEPFLYDTVNVPFWDGVSTAYPVIRVRMDFRDPNAVGTFVYHCHILEHEDGGMMGTIRVEPKRGHRNPSVSPLRKTHALCGQKFLAGKSSTHWTTAEINAPKKSARQVFNASVIRQ